MRVCVCHNLTASAVQHCAVQLQSAQSELIFRVLNTVPQCGACRNLVHSVAQLALTDLKHDP
jgi:bacterioferritin-associated ferredoxin